MNRGEMLGVFIGFGAGLLAGVLVGAILVGNGVTENLQRTAIENGVAEYRCDPKTGDTEFVWLSRDVSGEQAQKVEGR